MFASANPITLQLIAPSPFVVNNVHVGLVLSNFGLVECLDLNKVSYAPSSFEVNVDQIDTPLERVQAWLYLSLLSDMTPDPITSGTYQYALWNAKDPGFPDYLLSNVVLASAWINAAFPKFDPSGVVIYRAVDGINQDHIGLATPEPALSAGVGIALFGMALFMRRKVDKR